MLFGSTPQSLRKVGSWEREADYYRYLGRNCKVSIKSFCTTHTRPEGQVNTMVRMN